MPVLARLTQGTGQQGLTEAADRVPKRAEVWRKPGGSAVAASGREREAFLKRTLEAVFVHGTPGSQTAYGPLEPPLSAVASVAGGRAAMRFPTWLRLRSLLERASVGAVPVGGNCFPEPPRGAAPRGTRQRSSSLAESGLEEAAPAGHANKWINIR
jgi:hypothetical protein